METLLPSTFNLMTAALSLCLGIVVLARNRKKSTHQAFALLAANMMLWALGVTAVINSDSAGEARTWIILTEMIACFLPATCYLFTGFFPQGHFQGSRIVFGVLLGVGVVLAGLAPTPLYVREVTYIEHMPPRLVHGPAINAVMLNILAAIFAIHTNLRRKLRQCEGQSRRQTQFVMFGIYSIAVIGIVGNLLAALLDIGLFHAYGPLSTGLLMGIFAYAMIRFHLLDTRVLVSRVLVTVVLIAFVILSFLSFSTMVQWVIGESLRVEHFVPTLLAALFITLCFTRVRGRATAIVEGSLLRKPYDIHRLYRRIAEEAAEEVQLSELLKTVADHIQTTIGVRVVRVHLIDETDPHRMNCVFSSNAGENPKTTREHAVLLAYMRNHSHPLLLEKILHRRPTEEMIKIAEHLADLDAYFCLPLKTSGGLVGVLTLGQKVSGEVYSEEEMTAFRALVGPLGTAIANARLYEALDSVNLHLSRVLGQMREGVVAVDSRGVVTTINESAAKFFGPLKPGHSLDALPSEVADVLRTALREERSISDFETSVPGADGHPAPVVMSASVMKTPGHEISGAVALLYDLSQLKMLEQNVLRADRLSSLGILAAGMAHEIKNPLVSIKTFSQLLLQRYQDPDFRATFEDTVPGEVDRINSIVSRLLEFAKPRPVKFEPLLVNKVIDEVLILVENQTKKAKVKVSTQFPDGDLLLYGDEQQLHQVFLNLVLNALQAMRDNEEPPQGAWRGYLDIEATIGHARPRTRGMRAVRDTECVRITITDSGCGIPPENLQNLFTPFFTTKEEGSGLGLSVVHGIVSEHGGDIDVTSRVGLSTTFTVTFPVADAADMPEPVHAGAVEN